MSSFESEPTGIQAVRRVEAIESELFRVPQDQSVVEGLLDERKALAAVLRYEDMRISAVADTTGLFIPRIPGAERIINEYELSLFAEPWQEEDSNVVVSEQVIESAEDRGVDIVEMPTITWPDFSFASIDDRQDIDCLRSDLLNGIDTAILAYKSLVVNANKRTSVSNDHVYLATAEDMRIAIDRLLTDDVLRYVRDDVFKEQSNPAVDDDIDPGYDIVLVPNQLTLAEFSAVYGTIGMDPVIEERIVQPDDARVVAYLAPRHFNLINGSPGNINTSIGMRSRNTRGVQMVAPDAVSALFRINQLLQYGNVQADDMYAQTVHRYAASSSTNDPKFVEMSAHESGKITMAYSYNPAPARLFVAADSASTVTGTKL